MLIPAKKRSNPNDNEDLEEIFEDYQPPKTTANHIKTKCNTSIDYYNNLDGSNYTRHGKHEGTFNINK